MRIVPSVAAFTILLSSCADETPTYRYRLTVEVNTPEGVRTGSSVIEVDTDVASDLSIPTPGQVRTRIKGEAVTVDLGKRGLLFALLRSEEDADWAGAVLFDLTPVVRNAEGDVFQGTFDKMLTINRPITLPRFWPSQSDRPAASAYPMLVTFENLTNPRSVRRVNPDDLAATFGTAVSLHRVSVQMVEEEVTTGIESRLKWLNRYRARHFDGSSTASEDLTTENLSARLSAGSFSTEFAQ